MFGITFPKTPMICGLLALSLAACRSHKSGKNAENTPEIAPEGAKTTLAASIRSAVKAGRIRVTASEPSPANLKLLKSGSQSYASGGAIADQDLVSIDTSGTVAKVFNVSLPIYAVKATTNYLIVSGVFKSPAGLDVVDSEGKPLDCTLLAVAKTSSQRPGDIICLSHRAVGSYDPRLAADNSLHSHLGFATRGNKVYFTDGDDGKLYAWKEGDAEPALLYSQTIQAGCPGFADVFIDADSQNLCILQPALASCAKSYVYCGMDSKIDVAVDDALSETTQLGGLVVTHKKKIDLKSLQVSPRTANGSNGGLPGGAANIAADGKGGAVFIAYAWSLSSIDAEGTTCVISSPVPAGKVGCPHEPQIIKASFLTLLGLGNFAWTYGASDPHDPSTGIELRSIDLTTKEISTTNYLGSTGMKSISRLAYTSLGTIQVSGKDAAGKAVYAIIDAKGVITKQDSNLDALDQVVNL